MKLLQVQHHSGVKIQGSVTKLQGQRFEGIFIRMGSINEDKLGRPSQKLGESPPVA